jgi:hypothetical protein
MPSLVNPARSALALSVALAALAPGGAQAAPKRHAAAAPVRATAPPHASQPRASSAGRRIR